ncbi:PepSY-associated TM helix domain-containing protein [Methylomonas sp. CM2]|uniref:PepSY-associated TM helix domain-containing protein n=1 Tax=Methylomonas sp. CM2 TaxID=3417647 RepID=UPI003CE7A79C
MTRHFWVLVHRYAGLYMAFFLTVAGLTGCVLAFYHELDDWLNSDLSRVELRDQAMLDEFVLRDQALALEPHAYINQLMLSRESNRVFEAGLTPRTDPATGKPHELAYQSLRLHPYTGELLGYGKDEGLWPLTRRNILRVIYSLHYSLALDEVGVWLFGIAALIWTVDCFVAFYLTFPVRRKSPHPNPLPEGEGTTSRGFWSRWAIAWKIKWPASAFRLNFDLHRAGGLWTWLMLFVFAWSSVGFNLSETVYQPVMAALFDMPDLRQFPVPNLPEPRPEPRIAWREAHVIGRRLMAEQAQAAHVRVLAEEALAYQPEKGMFLYVVKSDRDLSPDHAGTAIWFDGDSGRFGGLLLPTGENLGLTLSMWLFALHMAKVWGLPFQIFVCAMGLVVAMLSVTGVYIWLKKRSALRSSKARQANIAGRVDA